MAPLRLLARLRRFARAKQGLAAIEFAFIAPVMAGILFGSIEVIDALGSDRRVQNVAASLADVTSRDTEISNAERDGLWDAANVLMFPDNSATSLDVRISSIVINSANDARVVWSEGHNGYGARGVNTQITTLPAAMMSAGGSVIMAEVAYHYRSPLGLLFSSGTTLQHTSIRRSRLVDPIPRVA